MNPSAFKRTEEPFVIGPALSDALKFLRESVEGERPGTAVGRAWFQDDPAFDKAAEKEIVSQGDTYYLPTVIRTGLGAQNTATEQRQKCTDEIVEEAHRHYLRSFSLIEEAEEEVGSLPETTEIAAAKARFFGKVTHIKKRLADYKIAFDRIECYVHQNNDNDNQLLTAISNFIYLADTAAYDALDIKHQVRREHRSSKKTLKAKADLAQSRSDQVALRKRLSPNYPPPDRDTGWTVKGIAKFLVVTPGIVREKARQLAQRSKKDLKEYGQNTPDIPVAQQGQRQTWNEAQMKRLVDYISDSTQDGEHDKLK